MNTPRTDIAAYNGHKYLREECAALEKELEAVKAIVRSVKSYPFVPQGLVAMVEKMEAGK